MNEFSKIYFRAPWGIWTIVMTVSLMALLAAFVIFTPGIATFIVSGLLILTGLAFSVRGYTIAGNKLIIHRPGWVTEFQLTDFIKATINPNAMRASVRVFGIGGFFGYTGKFSNNHLGRFRAYVTDPGRCVVIKFKGEVVVISPENPDEFLEALEFFPALFNNSPGLIPFIQIGYRQSVHRSIANQSFPFLFHISQQPASTIRLS